MDKDIIKKYKNEDITVVWKPKVCIHSTVCFKGLPTVFNPRVKPWIKMEGGTTEEIIQQIEKCPSGALSYYKNSDHEINKDEEDTEEEEIVKTVMEITKNGPIIIYGTIEVKDSKGNKTLKNKTTAFCRCGHSGNKPFCDGSHISNNFRE